MKSGSMTTCHTCAREGIDHSEIVRLAKSNPYWTGRLLCGFDKMSPSLHKNIAEWFALKVAQGKRRFIIMMPRDHYKTTLFGISTMTWFILNNPEVRILYMMSSCVEASKKLDVVKDAFVTSEQMRHFFPKMVPDLSHYRTKWAQDIIKMPYRTGSYPEGTVEARGITSRVTGGHFNVHGFDDLIDETMIDSVPEQDRAIGMLRRSDAMFVDVTKDLEIIIGTRWPGPFYDYLLEESGMIEDYETLIIGCYVDERYRRFMAEIGKQVTLEDGDPIFPEQFTKEALEAIRRKCGDFDFAHQWLNVKGDEADKRFREEDFMSYNYMPDGHGLVADGVEVRFDDLYRTMTIDPATGENSRNDKSAITVCGYQRETGKAFVLDAWHGQALPHALMDKIFEMAKRWRPHVVSPEDVAYQKTLKHYMRQEQQVRGLYFNIRPVKPGGQRKGSRIIDALQPFVRNHQLYIPEKLRFVAKEMANMIVVGGKVVGRSPNLADSLAYHPENWLLSLDKAEKSDEDQVIQQKDEQNVNYGLECVT